MVTEMHFITFKHKDSIRLHAMSVEEQEIYKNRVGMEEGWGWDDQTTKENI